MKYSNKSFPEALKEIMKIKNAPHRKLASKTNFSFTYFCVLKKRKKPPPIETIKSIAKGLEIPPEYFLEYRIDKITKLLNNYPSATDDVFNYAQELVKKNNIVLDIK
jgi:transcriptional regulator with XRE-family HTH domain